MITYCRLRPARAPGPAWAATCRREGTTTVELPAPGPAEVAAVLAAGLLPRLQAAADDAGYARLAPQEGPRR